MQLPDRMSDSEIFKTLVPVNSLTPENFRSLVQATAFETVDAGQALFQQGDTDKLAIYLLSGEVALSTRDSSIKRIIDAKSDDACFALAQLKPRQYTGIAHCEVRVARVDAELLDRLLTWDQVAGYEVTEFDGSEDSEWMFRMLRVEALQRLPPANLNALFARLEEVPVKAGQVIIKQGDPGDYYYIVKSGRVSVSRKSTKIGKPVVLGELKDGDGFGEEALLAGDPRNANVIAVQDGVLMRLARADFNELLKEPMVQWVSDTEARTMARAGAGLIDVRLEDEHRGGTIKGSINIPLHLLRLKAPTLDRSRKYIVYCQGGHRSCAAAFLLGQRGCDVYVLRGGLTALTKIA